MRLSLPADVNYIGHRTCENCKQLLSVDLSLTTLKVINTHTFSHCEGLTHIQLPGTLQEIHAEAFVGCIALRLSTSQQCLGT